MSTNSKLFSKAQHYIPGGVNSPVRAFGAVKGSPVFIKQAQGSTLIDEEGKSYIDYIGSWGPMILGHNHPEVIEAVEKCIKDGSSFGLPTKNEGELAELIVSMVPGIELVRMTTSGTEAVMSAVRLARAYTKRDKVVKCDGCYHGHSDAMLVKAGSGALTFGNQDSNGVTDSVQRDTIVIPYNDIDATEECFKTLGPEIAALIIEPVAANMGLVLPKEGYLEKLRSLCDEYGTVLIFDEVITGFRLARGGAQEYFRIRPDLTVLGKIIGGGYPVGAFGGRREIMEMIAPLGTVYHAGTLSGNPVSVAAGMATLSVLNQDETIYDRLESKQRQITDKIRAAIGAKEKSALSVNALASLFTLFFVSGPVSNMEELRNFCAEDYANYFNHMQSRGIIIPPAQFEANFISTSHSDEELMITANAITDYIAKV